MSEQESGPRISLIFCFAAEAAARTGREGTGGDPPSGTCVVNLHLFTKSSALTSNGNNFKMGRLLTPERVRIFADRAIPSNP